MIILGLKKKYKQKYLFHLSIFSPYGINNSEVLGGKGQLGFFEVFEYINKPPKHGQTFKGVHSPVRNLLCEAY